MFDYTASAELFPARLGKNRSGKVQYRRFHNAAEAIQYTIETLPSSMRPGVFLEVGEKRYGIAEIRALYFSEAYPLLRSA